MALWISQFIGLVFMLSLAFYAGFELGRFAGIEEHEEEHEEERDDF